MKRSSQEFIYSVILCLIFIGVASAGPKISPPAIVAITTGSCPSEVPPSVWRWGQSLPGGPPFANMDLAKIRLNCKEFELPEGTLIYEQYNIYVLKRGKETTDWWDLKDGKLYRGVMILKNAADSGELIQLLLTDEKEHRQMLNRRTSNFAEEKDFKNGANLRTGLYKQIAFVLRTRERDVKFQEFAKNYIETNGVPIPLPFKASVELLQKHLAEIVKMINNYDLQKPKK